MSEENMAVLEELIRVHAPALFGDYGTTLDFAGLSVALAQPVEIAAVIGFTSDVLRGSMAIAATPAVFSKTNVITASPSEEQDRDWAGELANQLLGRIKNRLLSYGAVVSMGTPMVISGGGLRFRGRRTGGRERYAFTCEHGIVEVWMEVSFEPGFTLQYFESPESDVQSEGDLLFF